MLSIRTDLKEGLEVATGLSVYFSMPPVNVDVSIPLIVLDEDGNSDYFFERDGVEIANLQYIISLYVLDPMDLFKYMPMIDDYCHSILLNRINTSSDLMVDRLWCKQMTYTCKGMSVGQDIRILR